jgi:hypothetical protein
MLPPPAVTAVRNAVNGLMSAARALLAAGAIALGLGAGWALSGRIVTIAILAVLIAAGNGYSKAYSP